MVGNALDREEVNVGKDAAEMVELLRSSLKSKDSLLKALKVGAAPWTIGHWTGLTGQCRALDASQHDIDVNDKSNGVITGCSTLWFDILLLHQHSQASSNTQSLTP